MSEPDYPIFEMNTDERGNLSVRISDKVTLLTQKQSKQVLERFKSLEAENSKLRELVNGLTWCCEHYGCDNRCPLYDRSEPDHCREQRLKQELGF